MDDLFRREALHVRRRQLLGVIRLATPVSHQVWAVVAAVISVAIVAWLFLGHYTHRDHVAGTLVPKAGLLNVTARDAGTATNVDIREGVHVRAGEVLLAVSGDSSSAAIGDTGATVAEKLRAQTSQIGATIAGLEPATSAQAEDLRARIGMLHGQLVQINAQEALQRKPAASAANLVKKAKPLHRRGVVSTIQFDQYQNQALAQHGVLVV